MSYRIQVYMKIPNAPQWPYAWCDVRTTNGANYEYETEEAAERDARLHYGKHRWRITVGVPVNGA